jgi:hypothetical protein
MMTVRFPNGQAVQYNDANLLDHQNGFSILYHQTGIKKDFIAKVPIDCLIEFVSPCRVYNPLASVPNEKLEDVNKELRALRRKLYRMCKK